jgi:hypothetical protein
MHGRCPNGSGAIHDAVAVTAGSDGRVAAVPKAAV